MKKLLVVLLALAMVFGLATSAIAAEYSDVTELDADTQDAIYRLSALDVLAGYPDGGFQPNANITRAEFAKIAVLISDLGDAADSVKNSVSQYSDVPAGLWYTGYVNMASAQGFFKGYADGSFKPNANINMSEVITVLLRIAGYDDNLVGSWPFDYIAMASKRGITDDVTFVSGAAATRAQVAIMTDATIDEEMVYWDADKAAYLGLYGTTTSTVLYAGNYDSIFDHNFNNGIVTDVLVTGWDVKDIDTKSIAINHDGGAYAIAAAQGGSGKALADGYYISDGFAFYELDNMIADIYYNKAETNATAEIVYIDVKSTVKWSDDVDTLGAAPDDGIKVDGKAVTYATYAPVAFAGVATHNSLAATTNNQDAKLFFNEDNELYRAQVGQATAAANLTVFDAYDSSVKRIDTYFGGSFSVKDKDVLVIKDGKIADIADLKAGDIFYRSAAHSLDEYIFVEKMAEGALEGCDTNAAGLLGTATGGLTIAGKDFNWATAWTVYSTDITDNDDTLDNSNELDDAYGTTVKYLVDPLNIYNVTLIYFDKADDTTTVYGVVTSATTNINNQLNTILIYNQEGKEVSYPIVKSDGYNRPVWYSTSATVAPTFGDMNLSEGTFIAAKVSADGSIATKNIKAIVPLVRGVAGASVAEFNCYDTEAALAADTTGLDNVTLAVLTAGYPVSVKGLDPAGTNNFSYAGYLTGVSANVDRLGSRLELAAGEYYTITDDTVAFEMSLVGGANTAAVNAFDSASIISVAELKSMNDITAAGTFVAKVDKGNIVAIAFIESNLTSKDTFGVVTAIGRNADGDYATIDGTTYTLASAFTDKVKKNFVSFSLDSDNEAAVTTLIDTSVIVDDGTPANGTLTTGAAFTNLTGYDWIDNDGARDASYDAGDEKIPAKVVSRSGNTLVVSNFAGTTSHTYAIADNARIFYIGDDDKLTEVGISAVRAGSYFYALTTDTPKDDELQYIFVFDYDI